VPAGTACIFDTACWHTAMDNTSTVDRQSVILGYNCVVPRRNTGELIPPSMLRQVRALSGQFPHAPFSISSHSYSTIYNPLYSTSGPDGNPPPSPNRNFLVVRVWWVSKTANIPVSHSDEVLLGLVPGILPVYIQIFHSVQDRVGY
jgi:hypothetical protein